MKSEDIDLRDEVQYLRELVDSLMEKLAEAQQHSVAPIYLPQPYPIPVWWNNTYEYVITCGDTHGVNMAFSPTASSSSTTNTITWTGTNG